MLSAPSETAKGWEEEGEALKSDELSCATPSGRCWREVVPKLPKAVTTEAPVLSAPSETARGKQEEVLQKQREERQMEKDVQEFFERKKMEATAQKQFLASATKQ